MKKFFTLIILVVALQLLVVSATYAAPPAWGGGYNDCVPGGQYHCVQYGETLYSIGRMYNANPRCLADANGLWNPDVIYAGQYLFIPQNCQGNPGWGHRPVNYPSHGSGYYNCTVNCDFGGSWGQPPVQHPPVPTPYYGYDYTGYYYGQGNNRYSHTCGYNNNCW